jgi:hypothetical protein
VYTPCSRRGRSKRAVRSARLEASRAAREGALLTRTYRFADRDFCVVDRAPPQATLRREFRLEVAHVALQACNTLNVQIVVHGGLALAGLRRSAGRRRSRVGLADGVAQRWLSGTARIATLTGRPWQRGAPVLPSNLGISALVAPLHRACMMHTQRRCHVTRLSSTGEDECCPPTNAIIRPAEHGCADEQRGGWWENT